MTGLVELVAMSQLGDVYVIRDADARWWLMSPLSGAAQQELKTQAEVDQAISYGDLREVGRPFDAYSDLGNYLSEQASLVPIAGIARDQVHSAQQVELLLAGALDWASDGTIEGLETAAATIDRLLQSTAAQNDELLKRRLQTQQSAVQQKFQNLLLSLEDHPRRDYLLSTLLWRMDGPRPSPAYEPRDSGHGHNEAPEGDEKEAG